MTPEGSLFPYLVGGSSVLRKVETRLRALGLEFDKICGAKCPWRVFARRFARAVAT